ncbi:MAG TPA: hypothetical protein VNP90_10165 [Actinomycetota bacterium]|nr:hypothetical protein [Actinomycetota bacterium]
MSILKDRIRPLDPFSLQEFLAPDHEAAADEEHAGTSPEREVGISPAEDGSPHVPLGRTAFELASRGGYVRTVTGTVAYLDEEAETYMVLRGNGDGELLRVPLRDITSAHETATDTPLGFGRDAEGFGTGH